MGSAGAKQGCDLASLAAEQHRGTTTRLAADLEVLPSHPAAHAGPYGLHGSFFCGEARCETLHGIRFRLAVPDLGGSENTGKKTISETIDGLRDPRHFNDVNPGSKNHDASLP